MKTTTIPELIDNALEGLTDKEKAAALKWSIIKSMLDNGYTTEQAHKFVEELIDSANMVRGSMPNE